MNNDLKQWCRDLRDAGVWRYNLPRTVSAKSWDEKRAEIAQNLSKMGYRKVENTLGMDGVYPDTVSVAEYFKAKLEEWDENDKGYSDDEYTPSYWRDPGTFDKVKDNPIVECQGFHEDEPYVFDDCPHCYSTFLTTEDLPRTCPECGHIQEPELPRRAVELLNRLDDAIQKVDLSKVKDNALAEQHNTTHSLMGDYPFRMRHYDVWKRFHRSRKQPDLMVEINND